MRHKLLRLLLIPAAVLALAASVLGIAELAVRLEPVTAASQPPAGDYVQLQADERLFTLFAALNAGGYDEENNERGMSPVRVQVRAALANRRGEETSPLPSLARLRPYFQMCRFIHVSQCATWILQRGPAPRFARAADGWALDAPAFPFLGFDRALAAFYAEADIASLWQAQRPAYDAEIARYRGLVTPAVDEVFAYLKITQPPTEGVIVLPNLLDAYWRGYGPRVGDLSYVVMGPAVEPNIGLIQHEAMHPILNPLVDAHLGAVERSPGRPPLCRAQATRLGRLSHLAEHPARKRHPRGRGAPGRSGRPRAADPPGGGRRLPPRAPPRRPPGRLRGERAGAGGVHAAPAGCAERRSHLAVKPLACRAWAAPCNLPGESAYKHTERFTHLKRRAARGFSEAHG